MGFILVLLLGLLGFAFWMWKRPDPVKRDQAKALYHDLWLEQVDAQLQHATALLADPQQANFPRAYEIFKNLAKQHELPEAYIQMALMHLHGQGCEPSVEIASNLLKHAFHLGSDTAAYHLGQIVETDAYHLQDIEKALYWYRHAVARGNLEAQYRLAELVPDDNTQAEQQRLQLLQQHADQGHASSQYLLAQHYFNQGQMYLGLNYLLRAAAQDHLRANQQLQQCYAQGDVVPQDEKRALYYLKRCVSLGDQSKRDDYYQAVLVGEMDIDQRQKVYFDVLNQAKQQHHSQAKTLLGSAYFHGWYLDKNETLGFRFWSEAAQQKNAQALSYIAALYYEQYLVLKDLQKAFDLYALAEQLEPSWFSQMGLGLCYLNGVGTVQNSAKAQQLFAQVAQQHWGFKLQNIAQQHYLIALFYAHPAYPLPTRQRCIGYLQKALEQGFALAGYRLYEIFQGQMLHDVVADKIQAQFYLQQAADLGLSQAQAELARCYLYGDDVEENQTLALDYLQKAAAQNDANALNLLGEAAEFGLAMPVDVEQAFQYYQAAAEQMNPHGLYHLGQFYLRGMAVQRDVHRAQQYFEKSALLGNEYAIEQLESIQAYFKLS